MEQRAGPLESDVLAIESIGGAMRFVDDRGGGTATAEPPATRLVRRAAKQPYASRANRIVVRHHLGRIVAVVEIVSPGNKDSRAALRDFVEKTIGFLRAGIHVLIVDLFPPTPRDPFGIHKAIWDEIEEEDFSVSRGERPDRGIVSGRQRVCRVHRAIRHRGRVAGHGVVSGGRPACDDSLGGDLPGGVGGQPGGTPRRGRDRCRSGRGCGLGLSIFGIIKAR